MRELFINIKSEKSQIISIGTDLFKNPIFLSELVKNRNLVIITDENVFSIYKKIFDNYKTIILPVGEDQKNFITIEKILNDFINLGIDKQSLIIGFGGGVVCDITGFAASIFMRGCEFGFVASTLLAQIDAAIGGKNGINLGNNKNFAGLINIPEFVVCDVQLLKTLSDIEYKSGLAELIKYAIIYDNTLFNTIYENKQKILIDRDLEVLNFLVNRSLAIKNEIVANDHFDKSLRHILNFGHSFGHIIETSEKIPHGHAVAKGMQIASNISYKMGILSKNDRDKIIELLMLYEYDLKIITTIDELRKVKNDKKKSGNHINFVLVSEIGKAIVKKIKVDKLFDYF